MKDKISSEEFIKAFGGGVKHKGKIGTGKELTNLSSEAFSEFINEMKTDDKDAIMLGYLGVIAQNTALIADRLMDLAVNEKEKIR